MAGILSSFQDPGNAGNLGLITGLLQAGGPSRMPVSFGQSLSTGLLQGAQMQEAARRANLSADYLNAQAQHIATSDQMLQMQLDIARRNQEIGQRILEGGGLLPPSDAAGTPQAQAAQPAGFSPQSSQAVFGTPALAQQPAQTRSPMSGGPSAIPDDLRLAIGFDYANNGGKNVGQMLATYNSTTDYIKTLRAAGIDPSSSTGRQLIQANIEKQNYIPPTVLRSQSALVQPGATTPSLVNPAAPPGTMNVWTGSSPYPFNAPIQGAAGNAAAFAAPLAAAQSGGKAYGAAPYQPGVVQTGPAPKLLTTQQQIEAATGAPMAAPYGMGGGAPSRTVSGPGTFSGAPSPGTTGAQGLVLQDQGQAAEQKQYGKQLADYAGAVVNDAAKAAVANRYLDNMQLAARDINLGKLAPAQSAMTQWAQAFGIELPEEAKKSAGSIQALTSMAIKMAGTATRQSDAQPSQLQYFKILESMPNEQRTADGFQKIVAYLRDANNYSIAKAQALQQWQSDHQGSASGFEAQWPAQAARIPFVWNQAQTAPRPARYNPATGKIER